MKYYINVFLIYSMLGYVLETTMKTFFIKGMNNGFLYGPWIPVYGFGCCLIIAIMRLVFNRIKVNKGLKIFLVFLLSMFVLTILEFIGGNLIELLTGEVFWNYSDMKYNFGHYICLEVSIIWGIMSLIIIYIIKPLLDKLIKKIPSIFTYLVLTIFIADFILTLILI